MPLTQGYSTNQELKDKAKVFTKEEIKEIVLHTLNSYKNDYLPELDKHVNRLLSLCKEETNFGKIIMECADFENSKISREFRLMREQMTEALKDDTDGVFIIGNSHYFFLQATNSLTLSSLIDNKLNHTIEIFYTKLVEEFDYQVTKLKIESIITRMNKIEEANETSKGTRDALFM
jgi:hypothetical protein